MKNIKKIIFLFIVIILILLFSIFGKQKISEFNEKKENLEIIKDISFEPYSNENKLKILVTIENSEYNINKIIYPDKNGNEVTLNTYKNMVAIDYEVEENGQFLFKAECENGETIEKTLIVDSDYRELINIEIQPKGNTELVTEVDVNIKYREDLLGTNKQYKIGNSKNWENYTNKFSVDSYTVLEKKLQETSEGLINIYARSTDDVGNKVFITKQILNLDLDMPNVPEIKVLEVKDEYAKITEDGVKLSSLIEIKYEDRDDINKLYSIDNGKTWNQYTGTIITDNITVLAKSQKKVSGLENINKKIIDFSDDNLSPSAADALTTKAFDLDSNTYVTTDSEKFILVDPSLQGKQIQVKWAAIDNWWGSGSPSDLKFYDESNNLLETITLKAKEGTFYYDIPLNCAKISYKGRTSSGSNGGYKWYARLYEINISDRPIIELFDKKLPMLTINGVEKCKNTVQISYLSKAIKKLYKVDDGDWKEYEGPVTIDDGQTLYAKGIDIKNNETGIK